MKLEDVYDKYNLRLLRYGASLLNKSINNPDVEDLVSNTWVRAMANWDKFENRGSGYLPWLKRICKNLSVDKFRKASNRYEILNDLVFETTAGKATEVIDLSNGNLEYVSQQLSKRQLAVLVLAGWGCTGSESADILNIPVNTVYTRMHYARKKLSTHIL